LSAIGAVGQSLAEASSEQGFLDDACHRLVDVRGYHIALIGEAGPAPECHVTWRARGGGAARSVRSGTVRWSDVPTGQGVTGKAIRTGLPDMVADVSQEARYQPWAEKMATMGATACAALPIHIEGQIWGALTVYAAEPAAFDAYELELLAQVARLMGHGLQSVRVMQALREARERLRLFEAAVKNADDAVLITDADLSRLGPRITFVNEAFCRALGYPSEEIVGRSAIILNGSMTDPIVRRRLWRCLVQGRSFQAETLHPRRDGSVIALEWNASPLRDNAGTITHFVCILREVTDRRAAAAEVERARVFLQATIDTLSSHVAVLSPRGEILAVNAAWSRFGTANGAPTPQHCIGTNYLTPCDAAGTEDGWAAAGGVRAVIDGRSESFYHEYACECPKTMLWFGMRVTPFDEPAPRRVVVVHEDVTARIVAFKQADNARRFLRAVMDALPTPLFVKNDRHQWIEFNRAFEEAIGQPRDKLLGRSDESFFTPDLYARFWADDDAALQSSRPVLREHFVTFPTGARRWILSHRNPITLDNGEPGLVALGSDITPLKQSEARLRLQSDVLAKLAEGAPLAEVLTELCRLLRGEQAETTAYVMLLSSEHATLSLAAASGMPPGTASLLDGMPLTHEAGICAATVLQNEAIIIEDTLADPRCTHLRELAQRLGCRAVWSFPVRGTTGEAIGTVAMGSLYPARLTPSDLDLLRTAANVAALAIEHDEADRREARAHEELRQSRARYEALARVAPVGIYRTDAVGDCIYVNDVWCAMTGLSPAEAMGAGWLASLYSEDRPRILSLWSGEQRALLEAEYRFQRPDGHVTWVLGRAVAERDAQGQVVGYVGAITDITPLKLAETEVRKGRNELAAILDATTDGIIIEDAQEGRYVRANAAMAALLDYAPEDIPGLDRDAIFAEVEQDAVRSGVQLLRRRDGSSVPTEVGTQCFEFDGRRYTVSVHRDIREREAQEARLRDTERQLVAAGRLSDIGTMASGFAHELNQPLTAASNFLRAAGDILGTGPSKTAPGVDTARTTLDRAANQMVRAGEIVRRLRDFIGRGTVEQREEDLEDLLREAVRLSKLGRIADDAVLTLEVEADIPAVMVDRIQIQQVVMNLIGNALEAMDGCTARNVRIIARRAAEAGVLIEVSDSGPGISASVRDTLFQPFTTTKSTGMGIGLSICRAIIAGHGSQLEGFNGGDGGAVFRFILPPPRERSRESGKGGKGH
jgi:two-component system sensor kinase FixL